MPCAQVWWSGICSAPLMGSSSRLMSRFCTLSSIFSGLVCKIRSMVPWPAPIGALDAIANLVVATG